jgi:hypothetical protein
MNLIRFILAILLFVCLLDMPYSYFQLVRYLAMIGFSILAYDAYRSGRQTQAIIFLCLVILFQPLFKISLGRQIWNWIDVAVGIWLLADMKDLKSILKK